MVLLVSRGLRYHEVCVVIWSIGTSLVDFSLVLFRVTGGLVLRTRGGNTKRWRVQFFLFLPKLGRCFPLRNTCLESTVLSVCW